MPPISPFRGTSIPTIDTLPQISGKLGLPTLDPPTKTPCRCLHGILGHFHGTLASMLLGGFSGTFPGRLRLRVVFFFFFFGGGGGRFLVMALMATRFSGGNAPVEVGW